MPDYIRDINLRIFLSMHASAQSDVMSPGTAALKILASFAAAFGVLGPASPTRCRKDSPNAPSSEISRSRFAANNRKERPLALAHERILPKPSPIMSGQSMHTLQQKYGKFTREWKASAAYKDIFKFFIDTLLKLDTIDIDSCMCLCLGSLSCERNSPGEKEYNRSMSQLVAFESLVELLSKHFQLQDFII